MKYSWVAKLHPSDPSCCLTICNNSAKKTIESRSKSAKSTRKPMERDNNGKKGNHDIDNIQKDEKKNTLENITTLG